MYSIKSSTPAAYVRSSIEWGNRAPAWDLFRTITTSILREILDLSRDPDALPDEEGFWTQVEELAREMQRQHGGEVKSWANIRPTEEAAALDLTNNRLAKDELQAVSADVFRWRMLSTFRSLKKKKRGQHAEGTPAPPSGTAATTLPPFNVAFGDQSA